MRLTHTMRRIVLTVLLSLVPGVLVSAFMGLGLLALFYVPGNLVLPLGAMVVIYHFTAGRSGFSPWQGLIVVMLLTAGLFAAVFTVDLYCINGMLTAPQLFRKDYLGWFWPALAMLLALPFVYRLVR